MPGETLQSEIKKLQEKVGKASLPQTLTERTEEMIERLVRVAKFGGYSAEYERLANYLDWITALPWEKRTEDVLDLVKTKAILDKNHYDLTEIKERLLEYIAVLKLRGKNFQGEISRAPILCLVGLVGTGKTTLAASVAQALGRKFCRVPFGGMGSALDLRGMSRLHADAEPGQIIKALRRVEVKNPVILLDEIDRVAEETRADIMGVLIELLDPEQNAAFLDHFVDYPFDLSEVLFIATANTTTNISTPVLDRMEILQMPSYTDEDKIAIGSNYLLPKILLDFGLKPGTVVIEPDVWQGIVRPLGFDAGIRTLERNIQQACRKIAKKIVEGQGTAFRISRENIGEYIPKVW